MRIIREGILNTPTIGCDCGRVWEYLQDQVHCPNCGAHADMRFLRALRAKKVDEEFHAARAEAAKHPHRYVMDDGNEVDQCLKCGRSAFSAVHDDLKRKPIPVFSPLSGKFENMSDTDVVDLMRCEGHHSRFDEEQAWGVNAISQKPVAHVVVSVEVIQNQHDLAIRHRNYTEQVRYLTHLLSDVEERRDQAFQAFRDSLPLGERDNAANLIKEWVA